MGCGLVKLKQKPAAISKAKVKGGISVRQKITEITRQRVHLMKLKRYA